MNTPEKILERGLAEQIVYHKIHDGKLFEIAGKLRENVKEAYSLY